MKQNCELTSSYCNYIKNNIDRICSITEKLELETNTSINEMNSAVGAKLSLRERGTLKKSKEKIILNLQYLYLIRDFFNCLSKNASGILLTTDELILVVKFAPYFDGVPVLEMDEDEDDDALLKGLMKEYGREFKEVFGSIKKKWSYFLFEEYLERYDERIESYIMPDIKNSIDSFLKVMSPQETKVISPPVLNVKEVVVEQTSNEYIECPNCHSKIRLDSKFCFACGNKVEMDRPKFCSMCGTPMIPGGKFCSGCGNKME